MSISVGSMSAGLGLDMSEFQRGMQNATAVARSNSELMSAEMKRTSREGAESLRLIDEAIGVHISRPLTRIIGQTQLLGPALASVFALSAGVAIGGVLFEQGKKLLEITGALEGWKDMLGLTGRSAEEVAKGIEHEDSVVLENLKRKIEMQDEYNRLVLGLKGADFERAHLEMLKQETAEIFKQIAAQTALVQARSQEQGWQGTAEQIAESIGGPFLPGVGSAAKGLLNAFGISSSNALQQAQVAANKLAEAMKPLYDALKRVDDEIQKENWKIFRDDADGAAAASEKVAALFKEMGSSLDKLKPPDALAKIGAEFDAMGINANKQLAEIEAQFRKGLIPQDVLDKAEAGVKKFSQELDELKIRAQAALQVNEYLASAQGKPLPGASLPTGTAVPGLPQATPVAPVLSPDASTTNAQFSVFSTDQAAQLKAAAAAYEDAVTPAEKYRLAQSELNLLLEKGLIDWGAYTAALQKANDQMVQGSDHIHKMQEDLQKLLERSDSATDGIRAFFLQLQINAGENGKEAFTLLNDGLQGFENNLTQVLTGGKAKWRSFFEELTQQALKFSLSKNLAAGLGELEKLFPSVAKSLQPPQGPAPALPPTAPGSATGLGAIGNPAAASAQTTFQTAVTTFSSSTPIYQTASTLLQTAATAFAPAVTLLQSAASTLLSAAAKLSISGGGIGDGGGDLGGLIGPDDDGGVEGRAGGGDLTPGMSYIVGEQGPEPLTVSSSGSAFISPHSSLRDASSGTTHQHFYDLRGADPATVQKLVAALPMIERMATGRAVASSSEIAKRTP